jgi:hypothetical protein
MQISGETVGEVKAVSDMHQRKAEMARQSDAFIALPGEYMSPELVCLTCWSISTNFVVKHLDTAKKMWELAARPKF